MSTDQHHAWLQLAETAMFQAELAGAEIREALYVEAKDALIQVETQAPGRGAWLMACLNVRMGNTPLARRWFERAHAADALPSKDDVVSSAYMRSVHGETWFQEIVARLR